MFIDNLIKILEVNDFIYKTGETPGRKDWSYTNKAMSKVNGNPDWHFGYITPADTSKLTYVRIWLPVNIPARSRGNWSYVPLKYRSDEQFKENQTMYKGLKNLFEFFDLDFNALFNDDEGNIDDIII